MIPKWHGDDRVASNSSNPRSLRSGHNKRIQSIHIDSPLNSRITPQILIRRKSSRIRRRLLRKIQCHRVLPSNNIPIRPVLQRIRLRELDQVWQTVDISWVDQQLIEIVCDVRQEIDFVDDGAVCAGVVGGVAGEVGVVHDCCTETFEDGD